MQVEDYVNDKLNFVGPVRSRTANEILKGFRAVGRRHSELALPILAVHGTSDHCTSLPVRSVYFDYQSLISVCLTKKVGLELHKLSLQHELHECQVPGHHAAWYSQSCSRAFRTMQMAQ